MKALSIQNLTKVYRKSLHALKGIDLEVNEGDFFALLGPNGAGKSTAIGIICSLVTKTSGKVNVFGYDIDSQLSLAKSCIGLVPQEFNFNIFEKVIQIVVNQAGFYGIPRHIAYLRAEKYLKKLGLWEKRDEISNRLSGGMKRRLMIARALIHEPKLLILDEPTAGVDIELRRSMWEFLREVNANGTTVILTTHYLEEAESLCKHVAIIDQGRIIENSSIKQLMKKLNTETFIFYLKNPLDVTPLLQNFTCKLVDEVTLEVEVRQDQCLNELFSLFIAQGIKVSSMRNKANRLEELFIKLVAANNKLRTE